MYDVNEIRRDFPILSREVHGRPLVYLDSRVINPLEDDALHRQFAGGFLVVDTDQPDWPSVLRELLDRPLGEIEADWRARESARRNLLTEAICGPAGTTGRRVADAVARLLGTVPTHGDARSPGNRLVGSDG